VLFERDAGRAKPSLASRPWRGRRAGEMIAQTGIVSSRLGRSTLAE
jgi:hypothetical protein